MLGKTRIPIISTFPYVDNIWFQVITLRKLTINTLNTWACIFPTCHISTKYDFNRVIFWHSLENISWRYLIFLFVFCRCPKGFHLDRQRCIFFDVRNFQGSMLTLPSDSLTFFQRWLNTPVIHGVKLMKHTWKFHIIMHSWTCQKC